MGIIHSMLVPLPLGEDGHVPRISSKHKSRGLSYLLPAKEEKTEREEDVWSLLVSFLTGWDLFQSCSLWKEFTVALWLKPHSIEKKGFDSIQKGKIKTRAPVNPLFQRNHRNYCNASTKVWTVTVPGKTGGDSWFQKQAIWPCSNFSTDKHFRGVCDVHSRQTSRQAKLMEKIDLKS